MQDLSCNAVRISLILIERERERKEKKDVSNEEITVAFGYSLRRNDSCSLSINRHGDWSLEVGYGFTTPIRSFVDIVFFLFYRIDRDRGLHIQIEAQIVRNRGKYLCYLRIYKSRYKLDAFTAFVLMVFAILNLIVYAIIYCKQLDPS